MERQPSPYADRPYISGHVRMRVDTHGVGEEAGLVWTASVRDAVPDGVLGYRSIQGVGPSPMDALQNLAEKLSAIQHGTAK